MLSGSMVVLFSRSYYWLGTASASGNRCEVCDDTNATIHCQVADDASPLRAHARASALRAPIPHARRSLPSLPMLAARRG